MKEMRLAIAAGRFAAWRSAFYAAQQQALESPVA